MNKRKLKSFAKYFLAAVIGFTVAEIRPDISMAETHATRSVEREEFDRLVDEMYAGSKLITEECFRLELDGLDECMRVELMPEELKELIKVAEFSEQIPKNKS